MMMKQTQNNLMMMASMASVLTASVLIILKGIGFVATGSVAILSSLFDSMQDLMTSLINMIAVRQAIQPADELHRFGHGKAQGIGSLLQGFIISISAIVLLVESVIHLMNIHPVEKTGFGLLIVTIGIILTIGLVCLQNYVVQKTNALSIKTDEAHYTGDILMNIGVVLSLLASYYLRWYWVDALFGVGVAVYLLIVVWNIMQEACAMLMDKELPVATREDIKNLALSVPFVKNVSSLKTRMGGQLFIQFNAQFDGHLTLEKAHASLDKIEHAIQQHYPSAEVIIHAEPFDISKQKKGFGK